jgi:hypothetical protein
VTIEKEPGPSPFGDGPHRLFQMQDRPLVAAEEHFSLRRRPLGPGKTGIGTTRCASLARLLDCGISVLFLAKGNEFEREGFCFQLRLSWMIRPNTNGGEANV